MAIITTPHTTTDYTYFNSGNITFAVPVESTYYTSYIKGGVCDGEDVDSCKKHLETIEKKRLLDSVNTPETCALAGFIWDKIDKYPQIHSPHCNPTYEITCSVQYNGDEPLSAICKWDQQNLTKVGMHEKIKRILKQGRSKK